MIELDAQDASILGVHQELPAIKRLDCAGQAIAVFEPDGVRPRRCRPCDPQRSQGKVAPPTHSSKLSENQGNEGKSMHMQEERWLAYGHSDIGGETCRERVCK